jgi:hypothetical protein
MEQAKAECYRSLMKAMEGTAALNLGEPLGALATDVAALIQLGDLPLYNTTDSAEGLEVLRLIKKVFPTFLETRESHEYVLKFLAFRPKVRLRMTNDLYAVL